MKFKQKLEKERAFDFLVGLNPNLIESTVEFLGKKHHHMSNKYKMRLEGKRVDNQS